MMIKILQQNLIKVSIICLILLPVIGNSQNAIFLKGGTNYNFLGIGFEEGYGDRFGYTLGLGGIIEIGDNLVITPEIGYSSRSLELYTPFYINDNFTDADLRLGLNYIDVSAHIGYGGFFEQESDNSFSSTNLFMLYAGPQVSFLSSQNNRLITDFGKDDVQEIERIQNYIIAINAGISLGVRNFFVDVRYSIPLNSFLELDTFGDALHTMNLTVGYSFMIR